MALTIPFDSVVHRRIDRPPSRPTGSRLGWAFGWAVLLLAASCGRDPQRVEGFLELVDVLPRRASGSSLEPIRLNDDLRLVFSEALDPSTVTSDSVQLWNKATGRRAVGRWLIEGRELIFQPRGPLRADLRDGGFEPGAEYVLMLGGFPELSGPRSFERRGLRYPIRHEFQVVAPGSATSSAAGDGADGAPMLRDASPDQAARVELRPGDDGKSGGRPLPWNQPLILACAEPLDPRWFRPEDFEVREHRYRRGLELNLPAVSGETPRIVGVRSIELVRNEDEDVKDPAVGVAAILKVTFEDNLPLSDGSTGLFELDLKRGARPGGGILDFSGKPAFRTPIQFFAARQDAYLPERRGSYDFEFLSAEDFTPLLDTSSDGTALWSDTGRLEVRYPRAAGDGSDGRQVLGSRFDGADLHATRLTIPEGTEVTLGAPGLVVLRSQGRIDIEGVLRRKLPEGEEPVPMWNPAAVLSSARTSSLSDWLEEAARQDSAWTVIIAGGDLVVRGRIAVDTPLLLVAGGMIRGSVVPGAARNQVWLLGEGGFASMPVDSDNSAFANWSPPLVIDEPLHNQLVVPLTFVALSSEVPKEVAPRNWDAPQVLGSRGPGGTFRVQFLKPDRPLPGGARRSGEEWLQSAVRHPEPKGVLLEGGEVDVEGGRVRMRIELQLLPPAVPRNPGPWIPPFVDRVRLFWTPDPR
ncbi:hypothetical protein Poly30_39000 [Planctomycetes bacterium Poly30]|uniref:Uncharacterized protein n=1 Tax=Saltatorellus ferox TaxID=2528018 RepID=A0A518EW94_9BACT|nr:hypothetical protein Poly30_39000 [Planctomycetes bacterium Poly30]